MERPPIPVLRHISSKRGAIINSGPSGIRKPVPQHPQYPRVPPGKLGVKLVKKSQTSAVASNAAQCRGTFDENQASGSASRHPALPKPKNVWSMPSADYYDEVNEDAARYQTDEFDNYNEEFHNYEPAEPVTDIPECEDPEEVAERVHGELEKASSIIAPLRDRMNNLQSQFESLVLDRSREDDFLHTLRHEVDKLNGSLKNKQTSSIEQKIVFDVNLLPDDDQMIRVHSTREVNLNYRQLCRTIPVKSQLRYKDGIEMFAYVCMEHLFGDEWELMAVKRQKPGEMLMDKLLLEGLKNVAYQACKARVADNVDISTIILQRIKRIDEVFAEEKSRRLKIRARAGNEPSGDE